MTCRLTPGLTRRLAAVLAAGVSALLLIGCGGGGGAGGLPDFTSIFLSYVYRLDPLVLDPFTATVGDRVQLLCYGKADSADYPISAQVQWNVSDPSAVAVDATGWLTALAPGSATITATYGSLTSDQLTVFVVAPGATPTAQLYPFGLSYYWSYTGTPVSPTAVAPAQVQVTQTVTMHRQVVIAGKVWWELEVAGTDPTEPPGYLWLRHDDHGLLEYLGGASGQLYRLQEPLITGNHWSDPADPVHTWTILSTDATITVPAGTYQHCVQVKEHWVTTGGVPYDSTAWFAPAVGLVRTLDEYTDPGSGQPVSNEQNLVQFTPGPV